MRKRGVKEKDLNNTKLKPSGGKDDKTVRRIKYVTTLDLQKKRT